MFFSRHLSCRCCTQSRRSGTGDAFVACSCCLNVETGRRWTSQSSGHVDADGCPRASIFVKTEFRGDEQRPGRVLREGSTAEEPLHSRSVLEHSKFKVNTTLFCDSSAVRGMAQRAGLGRVKTLAVKTFWLCRSRRYLRRRTRQILGRNPYPWQC